MLRYLTDLLLLSSCGSIILCTCMLIDARRRWSRLKYSPQRIVVWWAIADLLKAITLLPSDATRQPGNETVCMMQGWLQTSLSLMTLFWALATSINLVLVAAFHTPVKHIMRLEKAYLFISIVVPSLVASMPFILKIDKDQSVNFYGAVGPTCWISPPYRTYRVSMLFLPSYAALSFIILSSIVAGVCLSRRVKQVHAPQSSYAPGQEPYVLKRFMIKSFIQIAFFCLAYLPLAVVQMFSFNKNTPPSQPMLYWIMLAMGGHGAMTSAGYFATYCLRYLADRKLAATVVDNSPEKQVEYTPPKKAVVSPHPTYSPYSTYSPHPTYSPYISYSP